MTPQNFVPAARFSFIVSEQIIYKCTRNVFHIFTLNICILSTSFRMMKRKVIKSLAITILGWSTVAVVPLRKETDRMPTFYRPQRSWGKVMFLQVCVILFTGGGVPDQVPPQDQVHPPQDQVPPRDQVPPWAR